jgi:hypothetical protein
LIDGEKFGLWENGKRIVWFNDQQVESINKGELDFREFFKYKESRSIVNFKNTFHVPKNFKIQAMEFDNDA